MVVESYDWHTPATTQAAWKRMCTVSAGASCVHLPRGKHLLRLGLMPDRLWALDVRSATPFQLADATKVGLMLCLRLTFPDTTTHQLGLSQVLGTWCAYA